MRVAGKNTDRQWKALRKRLLSKPTSRLWDSAFRRFYRMRIDTRYLHPIASIKRNDKQLGEGFAIAALFCSLIEFLGSCEKGDNFVLSCDSRNTPHTHEYNQWQAKGYFTEFLKTQKPFDPLIDSTLVDDFYRDVRCALLHEARTKGGWLISSAASGKLISKRRRKITLFRNQLVPALEEYFSNYRQRLLTNPDTQQAFIRKFDFLCKP
jgi:hypothetical protein